MHELVTLVEGKGAKLLAGCGSLKVLVCNCARFQRKDIDHTVDPGRAIPQFFFFLLCGRIAERGGADGTRATATTTSLWTI